jgi:NAD(P)H dehydrogenase (quinone)
MAKILVMYYTRSGNTKKMAELVAGGAKKAGAEVVLKEVSNVTLAELKDFDGIVIGTPVYFGSMAAEIKRLFDDTVELHGELEGKVGAAFSSSANVAGGNETAILDILNAMLIHGMIVQGDSQGDHYGPVAIGAPDRRSQKECARLGERTAELVKKLF